MSPKLVFCIKASISKYAFREFYGFAATAGCNSRHYKHLSHSIESTPSQAYMTVKVEGG